MSEENEMKREELFEVVLLKEGVSEHDAKTTDFKRVAVSARDPLQALMHKDAEVKGYRKLMAAKPGIPIEAEVMARRRELDAAGHTHRGI